MSNLKHPQAFQHSSLFWLFKETSGKYRKFRSRLQRNIKNGSFKKFSQRKQRQLLKRIERLKRRLEQLQWQLKLALGSGALMMALSCSSVQAQGIGPYISNESVNPLASAAVFDNATPFYVDIDNDGDLDAFIGENPGRIVFFENVGTPTSPSMVERSGAANPMDGEDVGRYAAPAFVDIDGDGDLDGFVGDDNGDIHFFENTGDANNPAFIERFTTDNPLDGFTSNGYAQPTFADIDNDDDFDVVSTEYFGDVLFAENQGSSTSPSFVELLGASNPFNFISNPGYPSPAFADVDHDGDIDMLLGNDGVSGGTIEFFENIGDPANPSFIELTGAANPFDGVSVVGYSAPFMADVDGDGDLDLSVGEEGGDVFFFENQNLPPVVTPAGANLNFTENGAAVIVDDAVGITDDNMNIIGAEVQITTGFITGEDNLLFTDQLGITGNYDAVTGILTLTGRTTLNDYQTALSTISFETTGDDPGGSRNIEFRVTDDDATIPTSGGTKTVTIVEINDPPIVTTSSGNTTATILIPTAVDPGVVTSDVDNNNLAGATVSITTNFIAGEDVLGFADQNGITGSFDSGTGVLTLTGTATVMDYELALQSVTYENTNTNPDNNDRIISFEVDDGTDKSGSSAKTVQVTGGNSPPTINSSASALSYQENDPPLPVDDGLTIQDSDNNDLTGATISIIMNYISGEDVLAFTDQSGISGSFDSATGILTLSGTASVANYQTALQSITYENTSEDPSNLDREINFITNDGTDDSNIATRFIQVTPVNDPPEVTTTVSSFTYTLGGGPVVIDPGVTVTDVDDNQMESAEIGISNNYVIGEDILGFTDQNGITGSFDASSGIMSLSGTASITNYQSALRSVTYENTSNEPTTIIRTIGFSVNDGADNSPVSNTQNEIEIDVIPGEIVVYNAVSPNGDGKHDFLEIANIAAFPNNQVKIFNRWGDNVFEIAGYDNQSRIFVGLSDSGNELPEGTYYYSINLNDGSNTLSGFLVLNR